MLESNTNLSNLLTDPSLLALKGYVNGQWIDASDVNTPKVTNPARGDVICTVADLKPAMM